MTWLRKSVLRWPWLYVALAAVLTLITASLIPRLQFDSITSMIPMMIQYWVNRWSH